MRVNIEDNQCFSEYCLFRSALWSGALGCALLAFTVLVGSAQAPEVHAWGRRSVPHLPFVNALRTVVYSLSLACSWSDRDTDRRLSTNKIALQDALIGTFESEHYNQRDDDSNESNLDDWDNQIEYFAGNNTSSLVGSVGRPSTLSDKEDTEASASASFDAVVAAQLAKPELVPGQCPSPMVLSFHNIQLSVPPPQGSCKGPGMCCGSEKVDEDGDSFNGSPAKVTTFDVPIITSSSFSFSYFLSVISSGLSSWATQVVPLTFFWEGNSTSLGMLVGLPRGFNGSPRLPLVVEQIMPDSWAQQSGIKPGDGLVSVGGSKLTAVQDLQVSFVAYLLPVVDIVRYKKYKENKHRQVSVLCIQRLMFVSAILLNY
jgi:hypothetical protein